MTADGDVGVLLRGQGHSTRVRVRSPGLGPGRLPLPALRESSNLLRQRDKASSTEPRALRVEGGRIAGSADVAEAVQPGLMVQIGRAHV